MTNVPQKRFHALALIAGALLAPLGSSGYGESLSDARNIQTGEANFVEPSSTTALINQGVEPEIEKRWRELLLELRCLVCQNQSLYDSPSHIAEDLKHYIKRRIVQGWSDDRIKMDLVSKYGKFIVYQPAVEKHTIILWVGPFAVLVLALFLFVRFVVGTKRRIR